MLLNKFYFRLLLFTLLIFIDFITKFLIISCLYKYQSIKIIPNFFNIVFYQNTGSIFGMLSGYNNLLLIYSFIIFIIFIIFYNSIIIMFNNNHLSMILILSGIFGNSIDRLCYSCVIDFLDFHFYQIHYPAFNIADSYIVIGVFIFLLSMFCKNKNNII